MKQFLIACLFISSFSGNAQELLMQLTNAQVNGNQVTYDLVVENFTDIVAIQYGIAFDTQVLTFVEIQNIAIISMSQGNFNVKPGSIVNVWVDFNVAGVTLPDGTVLYQIVFEMVNDTFGTVCFSDEAIDYEFATNTGVMNSFSIVDDCHAEPFQIIIHPSAAENIAQDYGIQINTFVQAQNVSISFATERKMSFTLLDLSGRMIQSIPEHSYSPGMHHLQLQQVPSGMYVLLGQVDDKLLPFRISVP